MGTTSSPDCCADVDSRGVEVAVPNRADYIKLPQVICQMYMNDIANACGCSGFTEKAFEFPDLEKGYL